MERYSWLLAKKKLEKASGTDLLSKPPTLHEDNNTPSRGLMQLVLSVSPDARGLCTASQLKKRLAGFPLTSGLSLCSPRLSSHVALLGLA